jgi:Co/Zn/Cd efflux system component
MDPAMGIVGALLVARWSLGLIRQTSAVLLDQQDEEAAEAIRDTLEADGQTAVTDLHVWAIGPGLRAAEIVLTTDAPEPPNAYKIRLPDRLGLVHVTVEAHERPIDAAPNRATGNTAKGRA